MKKRIFSMLLAVILVINMVPMTALAQEEPATETSLGEVVEGTQLPEEPVEEPAEDVVGEVRLMGALLSSTPTGTQLTSTTQVLSGNYYLSGNVTMTKVLWLKSGDVTLDLNGYVLTLKQGSYGIRVDGGTLTIKDSNPTATHRFTSSTSDAWTLDEANGDVTVNGGVITGGHNYHESDDCTGDSKKHTGGGAIYIYGGDVIMDGGNIVGNKGSQPESYTNDGTFGGAAVYLASTATFTMNGGSLQGNAIFARNFAQGGAIWNFGTVAINEGSVINRNIANSTKKNGLGGAIYNAGTITILNGTLSANTASASGGSIYNGSSGTIEALSGTISGNTAVLYGAGVYNYGTITTLNAAISENEATYGGGIYNYNALTDLSGTIEDNKATYGGGIYNKRTITSLGGTISGNTATSAGGGIYNENTIKTLSATISNNEALTSNGFGGGIYLYTDSKLETLSESATISGNKAKYGGGIFSNRCKIENLSGTISNNEVIYSGGGIYTAGTIDTLNATISGNKSTGNGGGIFIDSSGTVYNYGKVIDNTANSLGGGIYQIGTLYLGKGSYVVGNKVGSNNDNISASNSAKVHICTDEENKLTASASMGINYNNNTTYQSGYFSNDAYTGDLAHFFSDSALFGVTLKEGKVFLASHTHNWSYTASGNVITATCAEDDSIVPTCDAGKTQALTLNASACNKTYDGSACAAATVTASAKWSETGKESNPTITYTGTTYGGASYSSTSTPSAAGNYTASITIDGNKTASALFTINKANATVTAPTAKTGLIYDGSAQTLVNAGSSTGGTLQYRLGESGSWSSTIPSATAANEYKVYYKVVGGDNYMDTTGSSFVSVTIGKATASIGAPTAKTLTYTGSAQALVNAATTSDGTLQYKLEGGSWGTGIPTATNAGTYKVYYKVNGDSNHNNTAELGPVSVTIGKATASVGAPTAKTLTYTGSAQALVNAATTSDGTLQYKLGGGSWGTGIPTATNAGTYKVYYKVNGDGNHNDTDGTTYVTVTIGPKTLIPSISGSTAKVYDGTPSAPAGLTIALTGVVAEDDVSATASSFEYNAATVAGANTITASGITLTGEKRGNYTLSVTIATKAGSISKATPSYTAPTAKTLTYTGLPQELVNVSAPTGGTFQYRVGEDGEWSNVIPKGTAATTYTVYYKVFGDSNHSSTGQLGPVEVTIGNAAATVTTPPAAKTLTYTGTAQELVTAGAATGGTMKYRLGEDGSWVTAIPTGKDVGTYKVYYKVAGDSNHNDTDGTTYVTVTIGPKTLIPSINGSTAKVYDGTPSAPAGLTIALTGVVAEDDVSATASSFEYNAATVAGANTITASGITLTGEKSGNYTLSAASVDIAGAITKKPIDVPADPASKTHTGATLNSGMVENADYSVSDPGGVTVGSYDVTLTLKNPANTKWATGEDTATRMLTFSITQATGTVTITNDISKVFDCIRVDTPTFTASSESRPAYFEFKNNDNDIGYTSTAPVEPGNYTVRVTVPADNNYTEATATKDFTISKRPVTITADNKTKVYGEAEPALTYTATGSLAECPLITEVEGTEVPILTRVEGEITGSYGISLNPAAVTANPYYELTITPGSGLTISEATLTVTADAQSMVIGAAVPELTYQITGYKNNEDIAVFGANIPIFSCSADGTSKGEFDIIKSSGAANLTNYTVNYLPAKLTVHPIAVTFNANGGEGTMAVQSIDNTAAKLTAIGFTRSGYGFSGWNTKADGTGVFLADSSTAIPTLNGNTTLYAQWARETGYSIDGNVVVTTPDGKTKTEMVHVGKDNPVTTFDVTPLTENVSAVVTVKAGAPTIIVDGLVDVALENEDGGGNHVKIELVISSTDVNTAEKAAITATATSRKVDTFLDLTIKKYTNGALDGTVTTTSSVLEIIIPFTTAGRRDITVYRYHDENNDGVIDAGETTELTKRDARPAAPIDGDFYIENNNIHVFSTKFSTYAIGYTPINGGGGSGTVVTDSADPIVVAPQGTAAPSILEVTTPTATTRSYNGALILLVAVAVSVGGWELRKLLKRRKAEEK